MERLRIGWIGTGVMGLAMCGHLLDAGYSVTVYNRTRAKAQPLLDRGATWKDSPREVGAASDVVFTIVGYPADVEAVTIGPEGALAGMQAGGTLCDMTTSSPTLAAKIAAVAAEQGVIALDAPVTGGDVGAREATLSIFVGGDETGYQCIQPCLERMGKKIMHCGVAGMGQRAKLANQAAVAGVMFSVCESLLFAQQAGLDVRRWHDLVSTGAAGSVAMKTLGGRMMNGDFAPGFFIEHFVKDLGLILEECRRVGLVLPGVAAAEQVYRAMACRGRDKDGTQALIAALAEFSGKTWNPVKE